MSEQANNTATGGNPTPTPEEKTFTQEQVNAFVQERLARERAKYDAEKAELETRASAAEKRLVLNRTQIPEDQEEKYLKLATLYPNDANDFEASLRAAINDFPLPAAKSMPRIVVGATAGGFTPTHDPIREGMGLNRKE